MGTDQAHPNADQAATERRYTVAEAADVLGLSAEAVRSRVARGTLPSTKENGTVFVLLGADRARPNGHPNGTQAHPNGAQAADQTALLVDALRDQVADLRRRLDSAEEANRENRRIIAGLVQRVPELQAPASPERRDAPETPAAEPEGADHRPADNGAQDGSGRRSWLHRFFFGE